ncbi:hypothetical protein H8L32_03100 [Undibacterium sp. CY18W]|uniref:Uncharacterized protein n=1 Tax=Undibacterium hunanense TaxID=2762292 RepID=A0ABR6ZKP3_9BURK|nr:hypothetical protein [Undibacterium hunanense]MBC3916462.1 hypothetical protein [Undibacterium hunanense]
MNRQIYLHFTSEAAGTEFKFRETWPEISQIIKKFKVFFFPIGQILFYSYQTEELTLG